MFLKRVTLLRDKIPSFNRYPFTIPAVSQLHDISFTREVTFLSGKMARGNRRCLKQLLISVNLIQRAAAVIISMNCRSQTLIWEITYVYHGFLRSQMVFS